MSPVNNRVSHSASDVRQSHQNNSPVLRIRSPGNQKRRTRHSSGCVAVQSLDDGDVIDRRFMDISDVDYDGDEEDDDEDDEDDNDDSSTRVDAAAVAVAEKRLSAAIGELRALDDRIQQEHRRYSQARAAGDGFKRFVYSRRLQLLALEGVRSVFAAYAAKCRDQLYSLIK